MNKATTVPRRQFIRTAAAVTAGGLFSVRLPKLHAGITGENDHFWYRGAPDGPYIDSQRENRAFGFGEGKVFLSEDNGKTWPHRAEFSEAENITISVLLKNGNVLFATRE